MTCTNLQDVTTRWKAVILHSKFHSARRKTSQLQAQMAVEAYKAVSRTHKQPFATRANPLRSSSALPADSSQLHLLRVVHLHVQVNWVGRISGGGLFCCLRLRAFTGLLSSGGCNITGVSTTCTMTSSSCPTSCGIPLTSSGTSQSCTIVFTDSWERTNSVGSSGCIASCCGTSNSEVPEPPQCRFPPLDDAVADVEVDIGIPKSYGSGLPISA
jgi:hypothetical protein